jgi:S1-C subfamily serine protease
MNRFGWNLLILGGIGVIALGLFAGATAVADDDSGVRVEQKGKVRIVLVDDDGERHEEVYEFDTDQPRPFLGVSLGRAPDGGALVEHVVDDSAAQRAGLQEGDVIVGIDGDEIDTPSALTRNILRFEPGDRVDVEVIRDGERLSLTAELGERSWHDLSMGFDLGAFGEQTAPGS